MLFTLVCVITTNVYCVVYKKYNLRQISWVSNTCPRFISKTVQERYHLYSSCLYFPWTNGSSLTRYIYIQRLTDEVIWWLKSDFVIRPSLLFLSQTYFIEPLLNFLKYVSMNLVQMAVVDIKTYQSVDPILNQVKDDSFSLTQFFGNSNRVFCCPMMTESFHVVKLIKSCSSVSLFTSFWSLGSRHDAFIDHIFPEVDFDPFWCLSRDMLNMTHLKRNSSTKLRVGKSYVAYYLEQDGIWDVICLNS